ncbi:hypothetical protein PF011_g3180 [Phytophthora fragariae]|uniref:Uncharacterized protein n=1 Tax=Phytophthora fragariae TaxID=53985 RepID=A0A6A3M0M4_9STRA|nr:hypothetical protein PF011_g3180 [Phytophthora fragariae]
MRAAWLVRRRAPVRPADLGPGAVDSASSSTTMTFAVDGRPLAGKAVTSTGAQGLSRKAARMGGLADARAGQGAELEDPGEAVAGRPAAAVGLPASDGLAAGGTAGRASTVDGSSRGASAGKTGLAVGGFMVTRGIAWSRAREGERGFGGASRVCRSGDVWNRRPAGNVSTSASWTRVQRTRPKYPVISFSKKTNIRALSTRIPKH